MLVQSTTQKKTPLFVLPLILEEKATYTHILLKVAVVTKDNILQPIMVILSTKGQVRGHEKQLVKRVNILRTSHVSKIVCGAVCLFSHFNIFFSTLSYATIIAIASCGLE